MQIFGGLAAGLALALTSCGDGGSASTEIWTESMVATLGAAIQATQEDGTVAWSQPPRQPTLWESLSRLLDPVRTAWAEAPPACPNVVSTATCNGAILQMYYNNCFSANQTSPNLRRSYINLVFPTAALCASVAGTGFTNGAISGLVGQTITRTFGGPDQGNYTMSADSLVTSFYTGFPSGFTGDAREGGVNVTFVDTNTRRISITGIHEVAETSSSFNYANAGSTDLNQTVPVAVSPIYPWDHTVNTVKSGDIPMTSGPTMNSFGTGFTFGDNSNIVANPVAPADGDATVVGFGPGATLKAGAVVRIQHNHSLSTSVSVVTTDLVFSFDTCCWPVSGSIHTEFDRFYGGGVYSAGNGTMPWPYEDLTFGPACGQVNYSTAFNDSTGLNTLFSCD
jgi:hypothetical protein